jgi:pentatricopeptide repeat protein
MEEWADATGNEDVRPNSFNYNSVISALANSHDVGAASRAEKILERMEGLHRATADEGVKPRTATYNAIIDAWAKSGEVDAADRAELLLEHMMDLYETCHNLDAKPNVRSFNSVLNAWAKSGHPMAPNRACEVLERMEELGRDGRLRVSPDATSFATVINAFARSHTFGKAERARDLLAHMKELYDASGRSALLPNSVVYNSVLNACAFAVGDLEEQSQAMEIANSMLVELNESPYARPDQVTYGTYLKVINNQMPPSGARDQVVDTVFRKCAKDGMVGEMVLRQLREMGMVQIYENLVGRSMWGEVNLTDLPTEWTCNVIEGKRLRRWQYRR